MRLWTLALLAVPAAAAEPDRLDRIMAALRATPHVEARYVERRTLAVLDAPLETRGTLRFDAPDRLEKTADAGPGGMGERVLVQGDALRIERTGAAPVVLSLGDHPEVAALVESVRAMLAGDAAALRRDFEASVAGDPARWQVVLTPRRDGLVRWVRVDGAGGRVTRVETQERDGDRTELAVEPAPT